MPTFAEFTEQLELALWTGGHVPATSDICHGNHAAHMVHEQQTVDAEPRQCRNAESAVSVQQCRRATVVCDDRLQLYSDAAFLTHNTLSYMMYIGIFVPSLLG